MLLAASLFAERAELSFPFQMIDFAGDWQPGTMTAPPFVKDVLGRSVQNGVRLFGQTEALAAIATKETGHAFAPFPPVLEFKPFEPRKKAERPKVGLINIVRQFKDFESVLLAMAKHADQFTYVIHTGAQGSAEATQDILAELQSLAAEAGMRNIKVQTYFGALAADEFNEIWASLDAIILPYDVEKYSRQGSGMFFESLSDSIIPVVPSETSMAEMAQSFGVGIVYDDKDSDAPNLALAKLALDFNQLADHSRAFAPVWRKANSPELLFEILEDTWSGNWHLSRNQPGMAAND